MGKFVRADAAEEIRRLSVQDQDGVFVLAADGTVEERERVPVEDEEAQGSVSRNVVKDMIAEIVAENGSLSDQKISDMLLSRGIKCARRTVGKYRSELNIDSSYTR